MKIEIEWTSSTDATMTIDGKVIPITMRMTRQGTLTRTEGLTDDEYYNTLGGRVANALYGKIGDLMQAESHAREVYDPLEDNQENPSWHPIPDEAASAFDARV